MSSNRLTISALFALAPLASAQQFVERPGVVVGPTLWSECVVPLDVNSDGLLDLFFLNAQGYAQPGDFGAPSADPLRPTLLIQTSSSSSIPVFMDRTDALIPAGILLHGKSVAVCDVDGDGLQDLVLAVAFGAQQRLLRKDPNGPGYLDETARLPQLVLNSFHVGWGDLDDDGDVDLVFTDAGPNSFSAPGGKARLLLNDGTGHFTEEPSRLPAVNKIGAQNAKLVDIDGDLDLDIVVDGKSSVTQVYFNDGRARFTLDTTLIPAAVSANNGGAYETEWGDLDGDLDLDCMYMNFAGGAFPTTDVAMKSLLTETGTPQFLTFGDALVGENSQDENEFALLDADDDGDLDVLIAALTFGQPATPEKLFLNSGSFGSGFLVQQAGAFTPLLDSTLDMAVADFNADGRYDVVTANGEIPGTDFTNRYYENVGPADSRAPVIGRVSSLASFIPKGHLVAGRPLRAWVQDAVVDDGASYIDARLEWSVTKGSDVNNGWLPMPHIGGNLHRAELTPGATSVGLVGAQVSVAVSAEDPGGHAATSTPQVFVVCGAEAYGASSGLTLGVPSPAGPGGQLELHISGGDPLRSGAIVFGGGAASLAFGGGTLLVDPLGAARVPFVLDDSGEAVVNLAIDSSAQAGETIFVQALARSVTSSSGVVLSNGVESVLCE